MKRLVLLALALASARTELRAQTTLDKLLAEGELAITGRSYAIAGQKFAAAAKEGPEDARPDAMLAITSLFTRDTTAAGKYADLALLKNPSEKLAQEASALVAAHRGNTSGADIHWRIAIWLDSASKNTVRYTRRVDEMVRVGALASASPWTAMVAKAAAERGAGYDPVARQIDAALAAYARGAAADETRAANEVIRLLEGTPATFRDIVAAAEINTAVALMAKREYTAARLLTEKAFATATARQPYIKLLAGMTLTDFFQSQGASREAMQTVTATLPFAAGLPPFAADAIRNLLYFDALSASILGETTHLAESARRILTYSGTSNDAFFVANANNFLGNAYVQSTSASSRNMAYDYYTKALKAATDAGLTDLANSVLSNLALSYWQQGDRQKAKATYAAVIADREAKKDFLGAEVALNNLGTLAFMSNDYAGAAQSFEKAVAITETQRDAYSGAQKLRFMEARISAHQFLLAALSYGNDNARIFSVLNKERARQLSEQLGGSTVASTTLSRFQQQMQPDEAAVFYAILDGGTILTQVVTRERVNARRTENFPLLAQLKGRYLDRINAKKAGYKPSSGIYADLSGTMTQDNDIKRKVLPSDFDEMVEVLRRVLDDQACAGCEKVANDFLGTFYTHLITPVLADVSGKKKLILFPDGILNFLPFAALRSTSGRYLVQDFDIRFSPSADVLEFLRARKYSDTRKSLFAMGGAEFAAMSDPAKPPASAEDWIVLRTSMDQQLERSASMRPFFATLGFQKMNYLPGSLAEVLELSKIVPGTQLVTGKAVTENLVKQMSADGRLKSFRFLHFSTHGYALSEFPEMSGIAMSIFPQAVGGEDGYLTAREIASLKMNADLVYLSACETALGRIYGGEGVVGLSGALLRGGANNAVITLWPVSDAASVTMALGIYSGLVQQKRDASEMLNELQRRFIAGEFGASFNKPYIWAPFIHYGQ